MFDLAWSEILLIAVVALLVIGPKQLPETLKGMARGIAKAKQTFRDFQAQADDLVKEANLQQVRDQIQDVKNTINEIRSFDIKSVVEKTVDADGTLKAAFNDPAGAVPAWTGPATAATTEGAPDFIPPATLAPYIPPPSPPPIPTAATVDNAPSFLPPTTLAPPAPEPAPLVAEAPAMVPPALVAAAEPLPAEPAPVTPPAAPEAATARPATATTQV